MIREAADLHRRPAPYRQIENLLGNLRHPFQD